MSTTRAEGALAGAPKNGPTDVVGGEEPHSPEPVSDDQGAIRSCRRCGATLPVDVKRGAFGFGVVVCEVCKRRHWYPLSRGMRVFYWVVFGLTVVALVGLYGAGLFGLPGAVGILSAVMLSIDSTLRSRHLAAILISVAMSVLIVVGTMFALVGAGLANAYSFEVVDRQSANLENFNGIRFDAGEPICGGGDDYSTCLNMHIAMYNSVCAGSGLPSGDRLIKSALDTCSRLSSFIDDVRARSASCGFGCTTRADGDGRWGWEYLRPVAATNTVTVDRVTHREHCWFNLGAIKLGNCPRE